MIGELIFHRIDHMPSGTRSNTVIEIFAEELFKPRRIAANRKHDPPCGLTSVDTIRTFYA